MIKGEKRDISIILMPKVIPGYREEARKKIIFAGLEVMSRKGYCSTTLDDIAHHVGVSKTTLYLYFPNKEDLVIEIIRSLHAEIQAKAMTLFTTEPMLDGYVHLLDMFISRDLNKIGFTHDVLALSARNQEIREIYQEHINKIIDNASHGIECLQKRGLARTDSDPRSMAFAMISMMSGFTTLILKGTDPDEIRTRFREIGGVILGIHEKRDRVSR